MDDEAAKLKAEWDRAQGWGRRRDRERIVATMASVGAALPVMAIVGWGGYELGLDWRLVLSAAFVAGGSIGWPIRQRLWPKGQMALPAISSPQHGLLRVPGLGRCDVIRLDIADVGGNTEVLASIQWIAANARPLGNLLLPEYSRSRAATARRKGKGSSRSLASVLARDLRFGAPAAKYRR
jgi:hypothetical protein